MKTTACASKEGHYIKFMCSTVLVLFRKTPTVSVLEHDASGSCAGTHEDNRREYLNFQINREKQNDKTYSIDPNKSGKAKKEIHNRR